MCPISWVGVRPCVRPCVCSLVCSCVRPSVCAPFLFSCLCVLHLCVARSWCGSLVGVCCLLVLMVLGMDELLLLEWFNLLFVVFPGGGSDALVLSGIGRGVRLCSVSVEFLLVQK